MTKLTANDKLIQDELKKHGIESAQPVEPTAAPGARSNELTAPHEVIEEEIEKKIAAVEKMTKVQINLTSLEVACLQREANTLDKPWKTHLSDLVNELLSSRTGKMVITGPSWGNKITGSSSGVTVRWATRTPGILTTHLSA